MTWAPTQPITLDVSNYQPAAIPAAWATSGVTRLIVGCQDQSHATNQIASARNLGIQVADLYAFGTIQSADDTSGGVNAAIQVAGTVGDIRRVWVDCERAALTLDQIREAVDAITNAHYQPGIYTGPAYWRDHCANSGEYISLPLWLADYFYSGAPWGRGFDPRTLGLPWDTLAVHQYTSTGTRNDNAQGGVTPALDGVNVDYNVWYLEEPMDPEVQARLDAINKAVMDREALRALASGSYDVVLRALQALRTAGIVP